MQVNKQNLIVLNFFTNCKLFCLFYIHCFNMYLTKNLSKQKRMFCIFGWREYLSWVLTPDICISRCRSWDINTFFKKKSWVLTQVTRQWFQKKKSIKHIGWSKNSFKIKEKRVVRNWHWLVTSWPLHQLGNKNPCQHPLTWIPDGHDKHHRSHVANYSCDDHPSRTIGCRADQHSRERLLGDRILPVR